MALKGAPGPGESMESRAAAKGRATRRQRRMTHGRLALTHGPYVVAQDTTSSILKTKLMSASAQAALQSLEPHLNGVGGHVQLMKRRPLQGSS